MGKAHIWELLTAVAALIVALCALVFSVTESRRSESFTRLTAMPHVAIGDSLFQNTTKIEAMNGTQNTAYIKWIAVTVDGETVRDWDEMYSRLGVGTSTNMTFRMFWPEDVFAANSTQPLIIEKSADGANALWRERDRYNIQICFCSALGDCEVAQMRGFLPPLPPVDQCEKDGSYKAKLWLPPSIFPG